MFSSVGSSLAWLWNAGPNNRPATVLAALAQVLFGSAFVAAPILANRFGLEPTGLEVALGVGLAIVGIALVVPAVLRLCRMDRPSEVTREGSLGPPAPHDIPAKDEQRQARRNVRRTVKHTRDKARDSELGESDIILLLDAYVAQFKGIVFGEDLWITLYLWSNRDGGVVKPWCASSDTPNWEEKKTDWVGVGQAGPGKLMAFTRRLIQTGADSSSGGRTLPSLLLRRPDLQGLELNPLQRDFCDAGQEVMFSVAVCPCLRVGKNLREIRSRPGRYVLGVLSYCSKSPVGSQLLTADCQEELRQGALCIGNLLALHIGEQVIVNRAEDLFIPAPEHNYIIDQKPSVGIEKVGTERGHA